MNKNLPTITLNVNGLNASIKRHRVPEWIRKHDPHICCLQETNLRTKKTSSQDRGIGRYTVPPRTSKRRKTTNLNTRNNHNCQKNKLYMGVGQSRVKEETFILIGKRGRDGQIGWRGLKARQQLKDRGGQGEGLQTG